MLCVSGWFTPNQVDEVGDMTRLSSPPRPSDRQAASPPLQGVTISLHQADHIATRGSCYTATCRLM
jgi:hypothetical protein